jgi:hypothetical protein
MTDWPLTASAVKGKIVPVHNMKVYMGSGGKVPLILLFGTR